MAWHRILSVGSGTGFVISRGNPMLVLLARRGINSSLEGQSFSIVFYPLKIYEVNLFFPFSSNVFSLF
jgi:hypothetical protein